MSEHARLEAQEDGRVRVPDPFAGMVELTAGEIAARQAARLDELADLHRGGEQCNDGVCVECAETARDEAYLRAGATALRSALRATAIVAAVEGALADAGTVMVPDMGRPEDYRTAILALAGRQDGARETPTLTRYGIAWDGPRLPIGTPMPDGYWTPWHIAQAEITRLTSALVQASLFGMGREQALRAKVAELTAERDAAREGRIVTTTGPVVARCSVCAHTYLPCQGGHVGRL